MAPLRDLLAWTDRLTGISPARVERSLVELGDWQNEALTERLCRPRSIDDAVRATLLVEDVEQLVKLGAPKTKLLSKLRDTAQFESTWAEFRCAAVIARVQQTLAKVELESTNPDGTNADLKLVFEDGPPHMSVEIKSLGMSDAEVEFCKAMNPYLDYVAPPHGFTTIHAPLDARKVVLTPDQRSYGRMNAARAAAGVPGFPDGLSGSVIVAHGTEANYSRRVASRVSQALRQLPATDECWVALYWTNGESAPAIADQIDWSEIPEHIAGIMFVGAVVAFPHRNIDVFVQGLPRDVRSSDERVVESALDDHFAATVLNRVERSTAVRASMLRGRIRGKRRQILRRDGSERIPPFVLLIDRDPVNLEVPGVTPRSVPGAKIV